MTAVKSEMCRDKPLFNTILIVQIVIAYYSLNFLITVNIAVHFRIRKIELYRHFHTANETGQHSRE